MSDLPKHEKRTRRKSSLARELQDLIDREERFKDNYGDFENSWTSTCVSPLLPFGVPLLNFNVI